MQLYSSSTWVCDTYIHIYRERISLAIKELYYIAKISTVKIEMRRKKWHFAKLKDCAYGIHNRNKFSKRLEITIVV